MKNQILLFVSVFLYMAVIACSTKNAPTDTIQPNQRVELPQPTNDELLSGIETTGTITTPIIPGSTVPTSENRDDLLSFAQTAFENGSLDEAISFADILILQNATDIQALELRADALDQKGDSEGAQEDYRQCCDGGRKRCCRRIK